MILFTWSVMIFSVFGQRDVKQKLYDDYAHVQRCMSSLGDVEGLILGGGSGLDELVRKWATENAIPYKIAKPNISDYPNEIQKAFDVRNAKMIKDGEACLVFWDGVFTHTPPLISKIVIAKKSLIVFPM